MGFVDYLRNGLKSSLLTGFALGLMVLLLTLAGLRVNGQIDLELDTTPFDAVVLLALLPLLLCLLTLLASPVVFVLLFVWRRLRRDSPVPSDNQAT